MSAVSTYEIGAVTMTRVPYFDVALDLPPLGSRAEIATYEAWALPHWTTADGQVLIGQAVWVIESDGQVIVVDPCGASDEFLRSGPEAIVHQDAVLAAMTAAGFPPESVDLVVLTHLDGIGLTAVVDAEGRWTPAFPSARIVLTASELDHLATRDDVSGLDVLRSLLDQGAVDAVDDQHRFTPEVRLRHTGAHTVGHAVVEVESAGERAVMLGHLAISPVQVAMSGGSSLNHDPAAADRVLHQILDEVAVDDALVIGPLWPHPGAGHAAAGGRQITPALTS